MWMLVLSMKFKGFVIFFFGLIVIVFLIIKVFVWYERNFSEYILLLYLLMIGIGVYLWSKRLFFIEKERCNVNIIC